MSAEMLRVLLEEGGDKAPVRWLRLPLQVRGADDCLADLESMGLVTKSDRGAPNPGFQLTAAGVTAARQASS